MISRVGLRLGAVGLVAGLAACGGGEPATATRAAPGASEPLVSIAPPLLRPDVQAMLNRANEEFERGEVSAALASYQTIVEADSSVAAGWFGLYMSHVELGNRAEAEEVSERLRARAHPRPGDPHAGSEGSRSSAVTDTLPSENGR